MALHDFRYIPSRSSPPAAPEPAPSIPEEIPGAPDNSRKVAIVGTDPIDTHVEDVRPVLSKGFHDLDAGMKKWLSDPAIRIPSGGDNTQILEVRVSGGEKSVLFWKQELQNGRVKLPILAINRTNWEFHTQKFSPPYAPYKKIFNKTDRLNGRVRKIFRPWPVMVSYQLTIWGEHKADVEYSQVQIAMRFNPLARMFVTGKNMSGPVDMHLDGVANNSDIESEAESLAKHRYDINLRAEAWLPLPEKFTPAIFGRVTSLREQTGEFLQAVSTRGVP